MRLCGVTGPSSTPWWVYSPVLRDASGSARVVVCYAMDAVAGARQTPERLKTGGVPPKPPATILLSVALSVLGLRFAPSQGVAGSFWPAVAATALNTRKDVAASLLPTVAEAANAASAALRRSECVCSCGADNRSVILLFGTNAALRLLVRVCAHRHTGPPISARRSIHVSRTGAWMTQQGPGLDPRSRLGLVYHHA